MESNRGTLKKLAGAARFLCGAAVNQPREQELDAELEEAVAMGADKDQYLAQQVERSTLKDFELYEENLESFMAFKQVQTLSLIHI